MHCRGLIGALVVAALAIPIGGAAAADGTKYPDWKGAWARFVVRGLGAADSSSRARRADARRRNGSRNASARGSVRGGDRTHALPRAV